MAAVEDELREAGQPTTAPERVAALSAHADVRVRVLCAKHPQLPQKCLTALARDQRPAVRRALAHRRDVPSNVVAILANDSDTKTRRTTLRLQEIEPKLALRLIEAGHGTPQLFERLREAVAADPVFATSLLFDSTSWYLAAHGSFGRSVVRRLVRDKQAHKLGFVVAHATLTTTAMLSIARQPDRRSLEVLARRSDLTKWQRFVLMVRGRPWLAAALLAEDPTSRGLRAVAMCRRGHIVTRARAATSRRPRVLWGLSGRHEWGVAMALASNPHIGRRTVDRLVKVAVNDWWAVGAALAQREDLTPEVLTRLPRHPAVQLFLAANPNTPLDHLEELVRYGREPFVGALASVHPALPLADRAALATSSSTPAWVLRRLANDKSLAEPIREQILAWLALGGASGDPNFEPITGAGTPGTPDQSYAAAYREQRTRFGTNSSLWRARMAVGEGAGRLSIETLRALAEDFDPNVRRVAAGYDFAPTVRALRRDAVPMVSVQASATAVRTRLRGGVGAVLENFKPVLTAAVIVVAILLRGVLEPSSQPDSRPTSMVSTDVPVLSALPGQLGEWNSGAVLPPIGEPVCVAGGTTVWVMTSPAEVTITVRAFRPKQVVVTLMSDPSVEGRSAEISLFAGDVRAFTQPKSGYGTVEVAIGGRPERPMELRLGIGDEFIVADAEGDC